MRLITSLNLHLPPAFLRDPSSHVSGNVCSVIAAVSDVLMKSPACWFLPFLHKWDSWLTIYHNVCALIKQTDHNIPSVDSDIGIHLMQVIFFIMICDIHLIL